MRAPRYPKCLAVMLAIAVVGPLATDVLAQNRGGTVQRGRHRLSGKAEHPGHHGR